jgi:DNA (cytosine-5)-methyltransferase 1
VSPPRLPAVSLFTNCGAGDLGYRRAGFRFQVLAEINPGRLKVASLNHSEADTVEGDLRETWPKVVEAYRRRIPGRAPALLAACPPCQGISSARSGRGLAIDADAGSRDSRNLLVDVVANVARDLSPRVVVVENVSAFFTRRVRHPDTQEPVSAAATSPSRSEPTSLTSASRKHGAGLS